MITVLAGGDSFVWGSELSDHKHGGPFGYSKKTFPALLADNYLCAAYPGIGNKDIALRVREMLVWTKPDVVIVCWTWPGRDDTLDSDFHIKNLEEHLQYHNIPYIFICADNCVVTSKLDYTNWFMFPPGTDNNQTQAPRGFYQWAVENKYMCGEQQHPLDQAHKDAAALLKGRFDELVKEHIQ